MAVLTEAQVRSALKDADLATTTEYRVPAGTVVTPAAKAWLVDQRVDLVVGERRELGLGEKLRAQKPGVPKPGAGGKPPAQPVSALPEFVKPDHFDLPDGTQVAEKPEYLTALAGNMLVEKDHPVIRLRGQLDSLEAQLVLAQVTFRRLGLPKGVDDLADVLEHVKQIMRAEVLGVRLEDTPMIGMTLDEIRHASHYPQEIFGIPHFFTTVDDGEAVATLNVLRTKSREVELAAYDAFKQPGGEPRRQDILTTLNRLSSVLYLMMMKAKSGWYR